MLKVAIHNPYFGVQCAETTVSKRYENYYSNSEKIQFKEVLTREDIDAYQPDFVISHSNYAPKISKYPTYYIFNESTKFRMLKNKGFPDDNTSVMLRSTLTFDGYLVQSDYTAKVLEDYCFAVGKKANILKPFANSFNKTEYIEPDLSNLKIAYFGTNWEVKSNLKPRFADLFKSLTSKTDKIAFYGPKGAWNWDNNQRFYQGEVPFGDDNGMLDVYRKHGVGLCLTRDDFFAEDIANNRIYEIAAAGAVIIADDLPFYKKMFGDSILYIKARRAYDNFDLVRDEDDMAKQVFDHLRWIENNPEQAKEMARRSHNIFCEKLSMDAMVENLISFHESTSRSLYYSASYQSEAEVAVILRAGGRDEFYFKRALQSIIDQTYKNVSLILVLYKDRPDLKAIVEQNKDRFKNIEILEVFDNVGIRSATLWAGLNAVKTEYYAMLDDDDEFYPNYLSLAIDFYDNEALQNTSYIYAGKIYYHEDSHFPIENKPFAAAALGDILFDLKHIQKEPLNVHLGGFGHLNEKVFLRLNQPVSTMMVGRSKFLDKKVLQDPMLKTSEDYYLSLILLKDNMGTQFLPYLTTQINVRDNDLHASDDPTQKFKNMLTNHESKSLITRRLFNTKILGGYAFRADSTNYSSEDHNIMLDSNNVIFLDKNNSSFSLRGIPEEEYLYSYKLGRKLFKKAKRKRLVKRLSKLVGISINKKTKFK